eukprot:2573781-Pleurochrysis_carterae.AAC.2
MQALGAPARLWGGTRKTPYTGGKPESLTITAHVHATSLRNVNSSNTVGRDKGKSVDRRRRFQVYMQLHGVAAAVAAAADPVATATGVEFKRPLEACEAALSEAVWVDAAGEAVPSLKVYAGPGIFHMEHNLSAERALVDVVRSNGGRASMVNASSLPYSILAEEDKAAGGGTQVLRARVVLSFVHVHGRLVEMHVRRALSKPWREQSLRSNTGDEFASDSRSTEFGWSKFPGGSTKQLAAMQRGTAYKLSFWEHPDGANFYAKHLKGLLRQAWAACMEVDEESCRKTLLLVPPH